MNVQRSLSVAFIALVTACVSTNVDVPRDHPANPSAPVAQVAPTPGLPTTASRAEAVPAEQPHRHDHAGGRDQHGAPPAPSASATVVATPAPAPAAPSRQADKPPAEVWSCPMHPEVVRSGPGQCPICGMNLVKRSPGKGSP
jgi:hypothetical protein